MSVADPLDHRFEPRRNYMNVLSLQLTELGENGRQLKFFLVGELPEMSIAVFENLNEKPPHL